MIEKRITFNCSDNEYPIVLISEQLLEFLNTKISCEKIFSKMNLPYQKQEYFIYQKFVSIILPERKFKIYDIVQKDFNHHNYFLEEFDFEYYGNILPRKPKKFEVRVEKKLDLGYSSIIIIFLISLLIYLSLNFNIFITFLVVIMIAFLPMLGLNFPKKSIEYKEPIEDSRYYELFNTYSQEVLRVFKKVSSEFEIISKENNKIAEENRSVIEEIFLKECVLPQIITCKKNSNSNRGRTELFFLTKLVKAFNTQILVDVVPDIGQNPFHPDFVLVCKHTGIHIDIEIDEPYSVNNGNPIHHDRSNDEERNKFFLEINWCVIRFSEKQVIENSDECVELIQNVLLSIKEKKQNFTHKLPLSKKWSYEESLIMSNNNYRNSYLPDNMKIKVNYTKPSNESSYEIDNLPF
ncbi:hypothetical protein [Flavobacterium sp.]|jgi:hypothetical protein|uniref:hypothetical protein n=1 Tax=Flavobacterium sp. TaxID=239 RepID=UPI0037C0A98A